MIVLLDQAHDARLTAQTENVVLLTNDLSAPVVDEALRLQASVIVSYRKLVILYNLHLVINIFQIRSSSEVSNP